MKPLVYLAGPYSDNICVNVNAAAMLASELRNDGIVTPLIPHWSLAWELIDPQPYETWLAYDMELLEHCSALLRWGGASPGAEQEIGYMLDKRSPVFYDKDTLYQWVQQAWYL